MALAQFEVAVENCCFDPSTKLVLARAKIKGLDFVRHQCEVESEFPIDVEDMVRINTKDDKFKLTRSNFEDLKRLHRFSIGTREAQILRAKWVPPSMDLAKYHYESDFLPVPSTGGRAAGSSASPPGYQMEAPRWEGPGYAARKPSQRGPESWDIPDRALKSRAKL